MDPTRLPDHMKWLAPAFENPKFVEILGRLLNVMQDPAFQENAKKIVSNPNLKWMYAGLVVVFVLYLILKRRVLAATDRWWVRIFLRLGMSVIYFFGLFLVSYVVLGQPLVEVLVALRKTFL